MSASILLLACALPACGDRQEVVEEPPPPRIVDTSVLDAARALLNQPPSGAIDVTGEDWQAELPPEDLQPAPVVEETTRLSTAARRAQDAAVLQQMAEFERRRDQSRGSQRDQPLEVSLEER